MRQVSVYDDNDRHVGYRDCPKCNVGARRRAEALAKHSSRTKESQKQTFDGFDTHPKGADADDHRILSKALTLTQAFARGCSDGWKGDARWLILYGERGVGKSHLCAAVDNHLAARNMPVMFVTMADLLNSLKEAIAIEKSTDTIVFQPRLDTFKNAPVLLLDDVGAEAGTSWSGGILWEVIDHRYRNKLPTMIATNIDLTNTSDKEIDQRITNRMRDTKLCIVHEMPVDSYRLRNFGQASF